MRRQNVDLPTASDDPGESMGAIESVPLANRKGILRPVPDGSSSQAHGQVSARHRLTSVIDDTSNGFQSRREQDEALARRLT